MNNDLTLFGILWGETAYDHLGFVFAVLALIGIIFDNKFFYWISIIVLAVGIYTISEAEAGEDTWFFCLLCWLFMYVYRLVKRR